MVVMFGRFEARLAFALPDPPLPKVGDVRGSAGMDLLMEAFVLWPDQWVSFQMHCMCVTGCTRQISDALYVCNRLYEPQRHVEDLFLKICAL